MHRSIMLRVFICIAAYLFASIWGAFASVYAQTPEVAETIKIDTRLVSLPVIVSDRHNRYVPNLTAADFTILQNGVEQKIEFFRAAEDDLVVAILIDTSESTREVLDDIKASARSFVKLLRPNDRAMIATFDKAIKVLSPLTSDRAQLDRAIRTASPDTLGTLLRDALFDTVTETFKGQKGRKAIILLTDGKDFNSKRTNVELLYELQESDALIYPIMFETEYKGLITEVVSTPSGPIVTRYPANYRPLPLPGVEGPQESASERENKVAREFLRTLSDLTAGRMYSSADAKLAETFGMILNELRNQYRLEFYAPPDAPAGAVHQVKVKVSRDDVVVRARGRYRLER